MIRRIALLLTVTLAVTGIGVAYAVTSPGASHGVILFVGDSNITLGAGQIEMAATAGPHHNDPYIPVFASTIGATTADAIWPARLATVLGQVHPDAVVVDLGINDAVNGYVNYAAKIDTLLAQLGNVPVLWTNLPCTIEQRSTRHGCTIINAALAASVHTHSNLTVLNWAAQANPHPAWISPVAPAVHLTVVGRTAWAALVVTALDART